jgi:hypothetical protein
MTSGSPAASAEPPTKVIKNATPRIARNGAQRLQMTMSSSRFDFCSL